MSSRILQIALLGNPVLRTRADEVHDFEDSAFQELLDDMLATLLDSDGVGLAAPQVYQPIRAFVMRSRKGLRFPNAPEMAPFEVVNPEVIWVSEGTCAAWEGCLSMPGYRATIARPERISARWRDRHGAVRTAELNDLAARVFLHELDHLNGKMLVERLGSLSELVSEKEMLRRCATEGSITGTKVSN